MKNLEILKTRKEEIIELTLELMPQALSGDKANRTFYFELDEGTNEIKVDYHYYLGQIQLSDDCFFTISGNEIPDPEEYGYSSIEEMDFDELGYGLLIKHEIENTLTLSCI